MNIVLHIPAVGICIVFTIKFPRTHTAGKFVTKRLNEFSILIFWVEEMRLRMEKVPVVI